MFNDEFKERYTTIPFAIYKAYCDRENKKVISHQHREIELIAMTEGEVVFYIDSHPYSLEKGDVLVIPPYSIHRAETSAESLTTYNCVCFDLSLIWDGELKKGLIDHTLATNHVIKKELEYAELLQKCIARGCDACEAGEEGWELEAIGNMSVLFGVLKRNGCFTSGINRSPENTFAQRVMDYIAENYHTLTSTQVAVAFYMNNSYFCRTFKKNFGYCFSDYVLAYRLEKAKIFLCNTRLSITEIAFRTGFNSCSYFGKAFRERFGLPPLAYRKMQNG